MSLYREGEYACISVADNGIGVSQEMIEKIMHREVTASDVSSDSNGVGLSNVITRLKLFFGRDDIFTIQSEGENRGTQTVIRIPCESRREEKNP